MYALLSPCRVAILDEHSSIFDAKLGTLNDTTVTIHVDPTAQPRFAKPEQFPTC